ncbi:MAG: FliM/FliN family flagellar motor switch protein [Eisenbergiella sp.]
MRDILELKPGQMIVLDKQAGAPADVVVKDRLIGKGDVLVSSDNFAVRITEIVNKAE